MADQKNAASTRTVVLFIMIVPIIAYLLFFAYKKNNESAEKASQCQSTCHDEGYDGYNFKWTILSGPQCTCLENS